MKTCFTSRVTRFEQSTFSSNIKRIVLIACHSCHSHYKHKNLISVCPYEKQKVESCKSEIFSVFFPLEETSLRNVDKSRFRINDIMRKWILIRKPSTLQEEAHPARFLIASFHLFESNRYLKGKPAMVEMQRKKQPL